MSKDKERDEEIEFSEDEIKSVNNCFENKDIIEESELDSLKKIRSKIGKDSINLGDLFLSSYDYLLSNVYILDDEKIKIKLGEFLKSYKLTNQLRELFESYGDGKEIGSYYAGEKIGDIVKEHREEMDYLIRLFFMFFGEEE